MMSQEFVLLDQPFVRRCFAGITSLFAFVLFGCGGDEVTDVPDQGNSEIVEIFNQPDDLPVCSDTRAGGMALVGEAFYVCYGKKWREVDDVVEGVCNIPACTKAKEGRLVSTKTDKVIYECKSGSWVDRNGIGFLDSAFIRCFMDALVRDSVETEDDLPACKASREGNLAVVSDQIMACVSRKWENIKDIVVSDEDLPDCVKDGENIYVAGKMAAYVCNDGTWFYGDEPVEHKPDSAESAMSSSSIAEVLSSSAVYEDDGVKVRGVCIASEKEIQKGDSVTLSFHNMGGTPHTYTWILPENSVYEDSSAASPTISFSRGGFYTVKLVINEGMGSESDTISCSGIKVVGIPVQGCICHTDSESLIIRNGHPAQAVWSVEGCTGEAPFTYEWDNGATGNENVATGETTSPGMYAPSVTVYNSDGESMSPTCTSVAVSESPKASCSISESTSGYVFSISNLSGISDQVGSVTMTLKSAADNVETPVTLTAYYDDWYGSYRWSGTSKTISLSGLSVPYSAYALVFEGDTVCMATRATCGALSQNAYVGESVSWSFKVGDSVSSANTYRWVFTDENDELLATSTLARPSVTLNKEGKVKATLVVDEGRASENTMKCSDVNVMEEGSYIAIENLYDYSGREITSGNYVVNSCSGSYGSGTTWYIYTSPTEVATWISSSVSVESDWGNGGMLYVTYPVYISIPEGESLIVSDCW